MGKCPEELRLIREMVAECEATGLISTSEWCSQLIMVIKRISTECLRGSLALRWTVSLTH